MGRRQANYSWGYSGVSSNGLATAQAIAAAIDEGPGEDAVDDQTLYRLKAASRAAKDGDNVALAVRMAKEACPATPSGPPEEGA